MRFTDSHCHLTMADAAANLGRNVARTDIAAFALAPSFRVTARRQSAVKIELCLGRQQTTDALVGNTQSIDLFE